MVSSNQIEPPVNCGLTSMPKAFSWKMWPRLLLHRRTRRPSKTMINEWTNYQIQPSSRLDASPTFTDDGAFTLTFPIFLAWWSNWRLHLIIHRWIGPGHGPKSIIRGLSFAWSTQSLEYRVAVFDRIFLLQRRRARRSLHFHRLSLGHYSMLRLLLF